MSRRSELLTRSRAPARTVTRSDERDADMLSFGVRAFDNGIARDACPFAHPRQIHFWKLGWRIRQRAHARWERQADEVDRALARAAKYLDADFEAGSKQPGKVAPSRLIALHFYALGSTRPDDAYAWFKATIDLARERYRLARGSGGRPSPAPFPIPEPAGRVAGAVSPQETSNA